MGKSAKNLIWSQLLTEGSHWPKTNASELHFARSFQGHPTWPYFARPNMRPNMPNMAKYAKYAYLRAYLGAQNSSRDEKWKRKAFTLFREVQSEKKMLSLFFEKWKVKIKCFHSFSRSEKWNQNASRLRSRSENSREFLTILKKEIFEQIYSVKAK